MVTTMTYLGRTLAKKKKKEQDTVDHTILGKECDHCLMILICPKFTHF